MLTLELGQGARGLTPGAAAVHLSRALEERICEAESPKVSGGQGVVGRTWSGFPRECQLSSSQFFNQLDLSTSLTMYQPCCASQAVREWLLRIAAGMEIEGVDLATVKGYKRIVLCQGVRDDVEAVLGQGAWSTFLPSMCEGRLQPTPWLNKVRDLNQIWCLATAHCHCPACRGRVDSLFGRTAST